MGEAPNAIVGTLSRPQLLNMQTPAAILLIVALIGIIELLRVTGINVPLPLMLIYIGVAFSATFAGLRAGIITAALAGSYVCYLAIHGAELHGLVSQPVRALLVIPFGFLVGVVLGYNHDLRARLFSELTQREQELVLARRRLSGRIAETSAVLSQTRSQFSRFFFQVLEDERGALARELHEQIAQSLTALKFSLHSNVGDSGSRLASSFAQIDDLTSTIRQLSLELRPATLDDFGLVAATRSLLRQLQSDEGLIFNLECDSDLAAISAESATIAYRTIQQAVENACKHGHAGTITVRFAIAAEQLFIEIDDDGNGFDVEAAENRAAQEGRLGLLFMRERLRQVDGSLSVTSQSGHGTSIHARVPLEVGAMNGEDQAGAD